MKKIFLASLTFYSLLSIGQVGINNTNPQQELHVSGTNSTIRIEGLNATNNPLNLGPNEIGRAHV